MRAVIVGSSSQVARRTAESLRARGAAVVGVNLTPLDDPVYTGHVVADMSDEAQADAALAEAVTILGGLDTVIAGTACQLPGRLDATSGSTWRAVMSGTLEATFHTLRAAIGHLNEGSAIVAITSVNAYLAHPGNSAYATAKGGVHAMITQAAFEYAARGIRINAVAPGLIDGDDTPDAGAGYPLGRAVTSQEVAEAVAFLASPLASGITGVILPVDGGLSIASAASFARPALLERWRSGAAGDATGPSPTTRPADE